MTRRALLTFWFALLAAPAFGQNAALPVPENQGTYLGALFGPVPEALYDHVPALPRKQGVLVTHVLPDSPAALAGLRRNDVVLEYDGQKVRDCAHFARLIQADRPAHQIRLALVRGGREATVPVLLGKGPALKLAPSARFANNQDASIPKALAKGNGPAPVSVTALPLEKDRMRVTVEYYQDGTGRLQSLTAEGATADIDGEVQRLPERERNLTRRALEQIRSLNSPKAQSQRPAAQP